jgi:hypothetical protein
MGQGTELKGDRREDVETDERRQSKRNGYGDKVDVDASLDRMRCGHACLDFEKSILKVSDNAGKRKPT